MECSYVARFAIVIRKQLGAGIVSPFSGGSGGCCCLAGGARGDEERLRERERERVRRLPHTGNVQSRLLRQLASFQGPVLLLGSLPDRVELPEAALRHFDTFSLRSRLCVPHLSPADHVTQQLIARQIWFLRMSSASAPTNSRNDCVEPQHVLVWLPRLVNLDPRLSRRR